MNRTQIEWALNPDGTSGYTWNPITGCLNGCEYCYARKLANTRLKERYLANINTAPLDNPNSFADAKRAILDDPFYPRFWLDRAREEFGSCYAGAIPKGIFVCDMSDLFGIGVPEEWTRRILNKIGMEYYRDHRFYLLTKQPQNLIKFSPFPDNCWVGVSVTNAEQSGIDRGYPLFALAEIEAKVKFISFEPLLEHVHTDASLSVDGQRVVDWVIIGAQTKPLKHPKTEWIKAIVDASDKAGIPVFLKNNLWELIPPVNGILGQYKQNSKGINFYLRQEMPAPSPASL